MKKIAEILFAEGIVAHVLHQTAAVGKGMSMAKFVGRCIREPLQQQGPHFILPFQINHLFVRKHGIGVRVRRTDQQGCNQQCSPKSSHSRVLDAE